MSREINPVIVFCTFVGGTAKVRFPARKLTYFGSITDVIAEPFPLEQPAAFRVRTCPMLACTDDGQYFLSPQQELPLITTAETIWYGGGQRLGCLRKQPEQQEITLYQPQDKEIEPLLRPFVMAANQVGSLEKLLHRHDQLHCGLISDQISLIPVLVEIETKPAKKSTGYFEYQYTKDRLVVPSAQHVRSLRDVFMLKLKSGQVRVSASVLLCYQNERPCYITGLEHIATSITLALDGLIKTAINKRF